MSPSSKAGVDGCVHMRCQCIVVLLPAVVLCQLMAMFETVGLSYLSSRYCELFTEDEWKGFDDVSVS